jgi:hypothetical protein
MTITKILRGVGVAVGSMTLLSLGATGVASAQESAEQLDTSNVTSTEYHASQGFRLSDDLILHPTLELDGGYQTNVFYEDDSEKPIGSALLRVGVGVLLSTQNRTGDEDVTVPQRLVVNGQATLTWNQYLTDSETASSQSDLGIDGLVDLLTDPESALSFELRDGFTRSVNPPPAETTSELPRDKNDLMAGVTIKPGGGALSIYGKVMYILERFEPDPASFANRDSVYGAIGSRWQWLPKTQLNGEVNFGLVSTDSPIKSGNSTPLRILVGASTLITAKFGTVLRIGYGNAFYSGASYNSFLALAELRYALAPTVRVAGGYSRDFQDALIGNYFADDAFFARFSAQMAGRVLLSGKAEVRLRSYEGLPTTGPLIFCNSQPCTTGNAIGSRDDVLFGANANLDFQANDWLIVGAEYRLFSDTTDAVATTGVGTPDSVGFVWQEVMAKATAKF